MKFSTRQDIEAPIDYVFAFASDFDSMEKQILRRGVQLERTGDMYANGVGMCWDAGFTYRGKMRKLRAELTGFDTPNSMTVLSVSSGINADFDIEFLPLTRNRTRLRVGLQMTPRSLSGRLLVQSLKFVKSSLDTRFENRIAQFGSEIETHYHRNQKSLG